ncbi:MAG: PDZ domain-containing protein [Phycisphaeraceae bacterium]|nr:PDZ domain-containing protein [Phycisphaeraceae bacterium]
MSHAVAFSFFWAARRGWLVASCLGVVLLVGVLPAYGQNADAQLASVPQLADSGQFIQISTLLSSEPVLRGDPQVADLLSAIAAHEKYRAEHDAERLEAYKSAMQRVSESLDKGRVEDALRAAVEANDLATDPSLMLEEQPIRHLVIEAERAADLAKAQDDWLEALGLYRALYLLFDDHQRYRDQSQQAERHVRLLRMYAPQKLSELYDLRIKRQAEQAKEDGQDEDEKNDPPVFGEETWQQTLDGVEVPMFWTTLLLAAQKHISGQGYGPLLDGAFEALEVLSRTRGLEQTFPALADDKHLGAFQIGLAELRAELNRPEPLRFGEASNLLEKVQDLNRNTVRLPRQVLAYEMADGAMSRLDDFSAVIWPHEMEQFSRNTQGKFEGIGVQISKRDGRLVVITPLADTPAQAAGIKAGDIIAQVDGQDVSAWSLDRAVREITGPEGTTVTLAVERVGHPGQLEFKVRRAQIEIHSILGWERRPDKGWDYYIDPQRRIGYIRLTNFLPQTADDLDRAINQMQNEHGLDGLILDLRFNPGGLLGSAIEVANRFIPSGTLVSTVERDGKVTHEYRARPDRAQPSIPLVVLINQGSASASEIVSGALQDYQRALIIGHRSFGKGSVQDLTPLGNGDACLKLTTQYYRLPKGRIIHRQPLDKDWGVDPDLEVRMTSTQVADSIRVRQDADVIRDEPAKQDAAATQPTTQPTAEDLIRQSLDPQLETALLVLKARLASEHIQALTEARDTSTTATAR